MNILGDTVVLHHPNPNPSFYILKFSFLFFFFFFNTFCRTNVLWWQTMWQCDSISCIEPTHRLLFSEVWTVEREMLLLALSQINWPKCSMFHTSAARRQAFLCEKKNKKKPPNAFVICATRVLILRVPARYLELMVCHYCSNPLNAPPLFIPSIKTGERRRKHKCTCTW